MKDRMNGINPEAWTRVSKYLRQAYIEVAQKYGGQDLAQSIIEKTEGDWPGPLAITTLEDFHMGATIEVFNRARELQKQTFRSDRQRLLSRILRRK